MKLLFVIDNLGSGGAQRQMVQLALGLNRRGHNVEFFIYYPEYDFFASPLQDAGIQIHKYKKKSQFSVKIIADLHNHVLERYYDVVLSFLDTPNFYSEIIRLKRKKPALVVSERNAYDKASFTWQKYFLDQFHHLADRVTVNSHYQAHQMTLYLPWLKNKLCMIYNGLSNEYFNLPRNTAKTSMGRFLSVGSIIPRKNVVGLAQALVEYGKMYGSPPSIDWAGVLHPTKESRMVYEQVNSILYANGLESYWTWLGECKNMADIYPQYLALIHPSFREGLPNAVCEAMASGLPVLLSNFGEHPRLIGKGLHGRLFDPNSPRAIANTIHDFLNLSIGEQNQISRSAYQFAKQEFALEVFLDRYESLFLSLS
jgi:glycosyltransferase involved in cell wall biosynthesis